MVVKHKLSSTSTTNIPIPPIPPIREHNKHIYKDKIQQYILYTLIFNIKINEARPFTSLTTVRGVNTLNIHGEKPFKAHTIQKSVRPIQINRNTLLLRNLLKNKVDCNINSHATIPPILLTFVLLKYICN